MAFCFTGLVGKVNTDGFGLGGKVSTDGFGLTQRKLVAVCLTVWNPEGHTHLPPRTVPPQQVKGFGVTMTGTTVFFGGLGGITSLGGVTTVFFGSATLGGVTNFGGTTTTFFGSVFVVGLLPPETSPGFGPPQLNCFFASLSFFGKSSGIATKMTSPPLVILTGNWYLATKRLPTFFAWAVPVSTSPVVAERR